jgi:hypothetical protein
MIRALRELVASAGPEVVGRNILEALRLPDDDANRLRPEDFPSLRYLFETFLQRPCHELIALHEGFAPLRMQGEQALSEAEAGASWFKQITTAIIELTLMAKYNSPDYIWRQLVEVRAHRRKNIRKAGLEGAPEPKDVDPGESYPVMPFASEKYVTGEQINKGLIIEVGEDLILEDQTGELLERAGDVGQIMGDDKESRVLNAVQDLDTVKRVFRPQGSGEALYRASAGANSSRVNKTGANALVDWTDIDVAMALFAAFTRNRDGTGKPIIVPQKLVLLTPHALASTAHRIVNATEIQYDNLASGVGPATRASNPYGGRLTHVSSNLLDVESATTWYLGAFRRQFKWYERRALKVLRQGREGDRYFEADVILRVRASEDGGCVAVDDCDVVQCPAS